MCKISLNIVLSIICIYVYICVLVGTGVGAINVTSKNKSESTFACAISEVLHLNCRPILKAVCYLIRICPTAKFYMPTFRNIMCLFHFHGPMKMEQSVPKRRYKNSDAGKLPNRNHKTMCEMFHYFEWKTSRRTESNGAGYVCHRVCCRCCIYSVNMQQKYC